jgi:pyruvate dehydrogenase E1 component alpha subunit
MMAIAKRPARTAGPAKSAVPNLTPENLVGYYQDMLLIRRFEEKAGQLYGMGLINGFCHLYIGQEAVVVGMQAAISNDRDSVITSYRDHGHMLACGMEARGVMAELTGRSGGYSGGKGGSMHMFSREKRFFGGHGIVGAQVPLGTGLAFAHKYNGDGGVCLCYLGDGAVNQGQVYESFNMAALWKLPVIYVIENNKYAMGTSIERSAAGGDHLAKRGAAYNIPGLAVDGMDVVAIQAAGAEAVSYARQGNGPFILEMQTYRYRGHSMSDPAKYRSKEEVAKMREQHDPIDQLRKLLIDGGRVTEEALKEIDHKVKAVVGDAADFAQASPEPDPSALWTDILIDA